LVLSFSKSIFFADITKNALLEYLNLERQSKGLSPLFENPKLLQSAYLKAKDILEKKYFSHWSPNGISPWYWFKIAGYDFQVAGENLAIGFLDSKEVHQAWMESPLHRQNILNPNYRDVGIAVLKGEFNGNEVYVVVQHFGTPKKMLSAKSTEQFTLQSQTSTVTSQPKYSPTSKIVQKSETATPTPAQTFQPETSTLSQEVTTSNQSTSSFTSSQQEILTSTLNKDTPLPLEKRVTFKLTEFATIKYNKILNLIIYSILGFLLFSLTLTIIFDIFVFRKFEIDYKDLIPKWIVFFLILLTFVYLDQSKLIQLIPHKVLIYGF